MRASPGTTHTFIMHPRYGLVHVIWPETGHGLDAYQREYQGTDGVAYRALTDCHTIEALEWHEQQGEDDQA